MPPVERIAVEAERYRTMLRGMSPAERLRATISLGSTVRQLAEAGLRLRHPGAGADEIRVRLTVRLYGRSAGERLFGRIPDDAI